MSSVHCQDGVHPSGLIQYLLECHPKSLFESIIPAFYGVLSIALILTFLVAFRKRFAYTTIGDGDSEHSLSTNSQNNETESLLGITASRSSHKLQILQMSLSLIQLGVFAILFSIKWLEHTNGNKHPWSALLSPIVSFTTWLYVVVLSILSYVKVNLPGLSVHTYLNGFYFVDIISIGLRIRLSLVTDDFSFHNPEDLLLFFHLISLIGLFLTSISLYDPIKSSSTSSVKGLKASPEMGASVLSLATFSWMNSMIYTGYRKSIEFDDIYDLQEQEKSEYICKKFEEESTLFPHRSLTFKLIYFFRKPLFTQFVYSNFVILFTFSGPFFLQRILRYLEHPESYSREMAYVYVFGLLGGYVTLSIVSSQGLWIGRKIGIGLKALIIGEVYSKSLRRQDVAIATEENAEVDVVSSLGKITNLMAVDAHKIAEICAYLNYLYILPMQIILTVLYLFQVLGWSAIAGSLTIALTLPLNYYLVFKWSKMERKLMSATDKRISIINEVLQGIRIIKFFAWEHRFKSRVDESRAKELSVLKQRFRLWLYGGTLWFIFPAIVTAITFYTYTNVANKSLTASIAFASLALFKALQNPLDLLPDMIGSMIQAKVSTDRVEKFLNEPESRKYGIQSMPNRPGDPTIGFKNATLSWWSNSDVSKERGFSLQNVNIVFPVGQLSIIAGPTGSGKTSLLMGLLGETNLEHGSIYLPSRWSRTKINVGYHSGVAYVSQQPWLQNDTIRNNILFGSPFDEERYHEVIKACALEKDLQILDAGDETEIGEKGITLSAGQKQRISLARAVYSRALHILMDDCLSAVGVHTLKHLYRWCIMGRLMRGRTRILVTHSVSLCLKEASLIVLLGNGTIAAQGKPSDLLSQGLLEQELLLENEIEKKLKDQDKVAEGEKKLPKELLKGGKTMVNSGKLVSEEMGSRGSIKLSIYSFYFRACGSLWYWSFLFGLAGLCQVFSVAQDYWIRVWVGAYDTAGLTPSPSNIVTFSVGDISSYWRLSSGHFGLPLYFNTTVCDSNLSTPTSVVTQETDTMYYVKVYLLLISISTLSVLLRFTSQFYGSLRASSSIHSKLLLKILHAPMRFFDTTPIGRIMNRFSKDIEVVDTEVSTSASIFLIDVLATLTVLAVISVVTPQFLYAVVVILLIYYAIAILYLSTSRELKRLESISRSPIYTQFGETLTGISTIRAFGEEKKFIEGNYSKIDSHLRPFIYLWAANRWLSTRIDIAGGFVAFFAGLFLLQGKINPNLAGLSLNYALSFTDHVLWCVRFYSTTEVNMNSVERVQEYMAIEQEPPDIIENMRPPQNWPTRGEISVRNLVLQYSPEQSPVIRDISFDVNPTAKVGIVGRTGAGKSTLALGFFRFLEPTSGTIEIDGVDICQLGVQDLRSNLTIIPQDPVLFTGTIRSNLDPFNWCTDDELWTVLKRVHLVEPSGGRNGKPEAFSLNSLVSENGNNFSQGQRQLLALGRALLKRSKLIILDEATASVDFETDTKIQATIQNELVDSTVLCIAHRLRTIIDYDKIIVMDHGKLIEYDTPYNLIQDQKSMFHSMCQKSGEFDSLYEVAKAKSGEVVR
ncbi:Transporter of the ATP-binding cassette (ABC) [Basidiobolus ranarum]|uniref:Transporter of the ATP-binding cassette (ABC) n=1 Tax=Basidiobolus ranarum TaxID=34480 RepID=A0ABR2WNR6_9FUNG